VPVLAQLIGLESAAKLFPQHSRCDVGVRAGGDPARPAWPDGRCTACRRLLCLQRKFHLGLLQLLFLRQACALSCSTAWIATVGPARRGRILRVFALAVLALYICHLVAAFIFLVLIGCFEVSAAFGLSEPSTSKRWSAVPCHRTRFSSCRHCLPVLQARRRGQRRNPLRFRRHDRRSVRSGDPILFRPTRLSADRRGSRFLCWPACCMASCGFIRR